MRYWDSSAIVPLLVQEKDTESRESMLREDSQIVTWWASRIECASALNRLSREGFLEEKELAQSLRDLEALAETWLEVVPAEDVRRRAIRLLRVHTLRSADAIQLAAALVAAREDPRSLPFLTSDERLRLAAEREGFATLPAG
jgi:predicted nucleic acid-binding protein